MLLVGADIAWDNCILHPVIKKHVSFWYWLGWAFFSLLRYLVPSVVGRSVGRLVGWLVGLGSPGDYYYKKDGIGGAALLFTLWRLCLYV